VRYASNALALGALKKTSLGHTACASPYLRCLEQVSINFKLVESDYTSRFATQLRACSLRNAMHTGFRPLKIKYCMLI
jgi:hypothetical protein